MNNNIYLITSFPKDFSENSEVQLNMLQQKLSYFWSIHRRRGEVTDLLKSNKTIVTNNAS